MKAGAGLSRFSELSDTPRPAFSIFSKGRSRARVTPSAACKGVCEQAGEMGLMRLSGQPIPALPEYLCEAMLGTLGLSSEARRSATTVSNPRYFTASHRMAFRVRFARRMQR